MLQHSCCVATAYLKLIYNYIVFFFDRNSPTHIVNLGTILEI